MERPAGLQDMFVQAQTTTDQNAKYDFIKKMQKIIVDEFCMRTFLYVEGDIAAKNKMFMMTCGTKQRTDIYLVLHGWINNHKNQRINQVEIRKLTMIDSSGVQLFLAF